jgi:hypothetical protein
MNPTNSRKNTVSTLDDTHVVQLPNMRNLDPFVFLGWVHCNWKKNIFILVFTVFWTLSCVFISENVTDCGNLLIYYRKLWIYSIQRKENIEIRWNNSNFIYLPKMQNFRISALLFVKNLLNYKCVLISIKYVVVMVILRKFLF